MTPEIVEGQFDAAEADARAAKKAHQEALAAESKALLDELLKKTVNERLKSLEKPNPKLLRKDRRALVRSLLDAAPPRRTISATTATWFEIWRSRLPYRVFPLAVLGISTVAAVVLAVTAYRHTPQEWVSVVASQGFRVQARDPDGYAMAQDVSPGDRFALMRVENGQGTLRRWLTGQGYAVFQLPVENLQKAD